jgi:XTP/dITP diphosphohydrolase
MFSLFFENTYYSMEKIKLVLATNNAHKVEEIQHFIGDKFELLTLNQIGFKGEIDETGLTLEENSLIKANYIWEKYKINCLADDSGLEVAILGNEPGVYSARYAGPQRSHEDNMNLLLNKLENIQNRTAQFRTVITLVIDGNFSQFEGIIQGAICLEKRGMNGFGYDPIFIPENAVRTFGEMHLMEKNTLSHRARAIQKMADYLNK